MKIVYRILSIVFLTAICVVLGIGIGKTRWSRIQPVETSLEVVEKPVSEPKPEIEISKLYINRNDGNDINVIIDFLAPKDLHINVDNGNILINEEKIAISKLPIHIYSNRIYPHKERTRLVLEIQEVIP